MPEQNRDWVADVKNQRFYLHRLCPPTPSSQFMFFLPLVASSWLIVCFCLSSRFVSTPLLITLRHVCPRRSLPPQAPTTPTQGSHRVTWRPSTKWATWASTSPRSGTLTTLSPQKSPWRTRWSHTTMIMAIWVQITCYLEHFKFRTSVLSPVHCLFTQLAKGLKLSLDTSFVPNTG